MGPKEFKSQSKWTPLTLEEAGKLGGGYKPLLQTSLREKFRSYNPEKFSRGLLWWLYKSTLTAKKLNYKEWPFFEVS
ncbi:Pathogen-related protein-like [Quillaja saponaria]|uniref:Pathogen-related protein-like n=1 Tax=Quillaja saponaria TaxID=32244 RepID=A0AAD7PRE2_QUISA|nr:Pathogen-related protein-like [Quillaja saponaria]